MLEDGLSYLTRLDLKGSLKTAEELSMVTKSTALESLEYLNVSDCVFAENSFKEIFESYSLRNLEVLGMARLKTGFRLMKNWPKKLSHFYMHKLRAIDLRQNNGVSLYMLAKDFLQTVMVFAWPHNEHGDSQIMKSIN